MSRVVILGAGIAGLGAAWRLLQLKPQWEVCLVEREAHPGGLAASLKKDGFRADLGPHRIFTELPEIEALLPELITHEQRINVQRRSELMLEGHLYRYPVRATELLRQMGPVRVGRLAASAAAGKLQALFTRSPEDFRTAMEHAFGKGVYQMLIDPYTRKVWKAAPEELSAEVARVRVSAGNTAQVVRRLLGRAEKKGSQSALDSFLYIRGGVEGLVTNLLGRVGAAGGRVELATHATGLEWDGQRVTGVLCATASQAGGGAPAASVRKPADYVISTTPITELAGSLQRLRPDVTSAQAASSLEYLGMVLVGVILRRKQFTANTWIYFPEEKYVFNRSYEPGNIDPSMKEPGRTMAVFEVTARHASELWNAPDAQIAEAVRGDLLKTGLVRAEEIESLVTLRLPWAYPLYTTGFESRLAAVFGYLRGFPNLITTGRQGLFNHNNIDHSLLMGIRAAEYIAREGAVASAWYDDLGQFAHFRIVD